jgi:hypothetical protein
MLPERMALNQVDVPPILGQHMVHDILIEHEMLCPSRYTFPRPDAGNDRFCYGASVTLLPTQNVVGANPITRCSALMELQPLNWAMKFAAQSRRVRVSRTGSWQQVDGSSLRPRTNTHIRCSRVARRRTRAFIYR